MVLVPRQYASYPWLAMPEGYSEGNDTYSHRATAVRLTNNTLIIRDKVSDRTTQQATRSLSWRSERVGRSRPTYTVTDRCK